VHAEHQSAQLRAQPRRKPARRNPGRRRTRAPGLDYPQGAPKRGTPPDFRFEDGAIHCRCIHFPVDDQLQRRLVSAGLDSRAEKTRLLASHRQLVTHNFVTGVGPRLVVAPARTPEIAEAACRTVGAHQDVRKVDRPTGITHARHDWGGEQRHAGARPIRPRHVRQAADPADVYCAPVEQPLALLPGNSVYELGRDAEPAPEIARDRAGKMLRVIGLT